MPSRTFQSSNMNHEGHQKRTQSSSVVHWGWCKRKQRWSTSNSMACGMAVGRDERSGKPLKLSRTTVEEEQKKVADNHGIREQRTPKSREFSQQVGWRK
jgi:hypothetical protein